MVMLFVVCSLIAIGICIMMYGIIHDWIDASRREKERLEREELKSSRSW